MKEKYMLSTEELAIIDEYRKIIAKGYGFGDYNEWPVKLNASFHLFLEDFGKEFMDDLEFLTTEVNFSENEIANLFYNPSRIFRIIDSIIYYMRRRKETLYDQRKTVIRLLDIFGSIKFGEKFNLDGCNIFHSPQEIEELWKKPGIFEQLPLDDSKIVHKFCGIMWAYSECLYFRAHDVPKELHGPYSLKDSDSNIVVQEYLNLRPKEIWQDVPFLPCNSIKIYKEYKNSLQLEIDPLNHIYHKEGDFVNDLIGCYIEVDGKKATVEMLSDFIQITEKTIMAISEKLLTMSWNEKVLKYADIYWYRKKPLRDARGLDWRVPENVKEKISSGSENIKRKSQLSEEESRKIALITI